MVQGDDLDIDSYDVDPMDVDYQHQSVDLNGHSVPVAHYVGEKWEKDHIVRGSLPFLPRTCTDKV